ncbi:MAG: lipoprotein [Gammaproteobacteria bacterium]|nr:lipoprotein [Gammaproteobacteria bacterium]MCY4273998.1 lipoprotein [Gammaproteobacteria bacterium]
MNVYRFVSVLNIKTLLCCWLFIGAVCAFLLSGCGQKGPLYIPEPVVDVFESETELKSVPEEDEETNSTSS